MSKKHIGAGNYGRDQGVFARSVRERAEQKAEATKKPPAPAAPVAAPKVRNTYQRLLDKIKIDQGANRRE